MPLVSTRTVVRNSGSRELLSQKSGDSLRLISERKNVYLKILTGYSGAEMFFEQGGGQNIQNISFELPQISKHLHQPKYVQ